MLSILADLKGMVCMIDNVLVHGSTYKKHDERLEQYKEKCQFRNTSVQFLGQMTDGQGIRPDPTKVEAIQQFKQLANVKELCQFLGMANHLNKFMPNLAATTKILRDLATVRQQPLDLEYPVLAICKPDHSCS